MIRLLSIASLFLYRCSCVIATALLILCQVWMRCWCCAEDEAVLPLTVQFLKEQGRMKFLRPLYKALFKSKMGKDMAVQTFKEARQSYHPIAAKMVAADLQVDWDLPEGCNDCLLMALTMSRNTGCAKLQRGMMIALGAGLGAAWSYVCEWLHQSSQIVSAPLGIWCICTMWCQIWCLMQLPRLCWRVFVCLCSLPEVLNFSATVSLSATLGLLWSSLLDVVAADCIFTQRSAFCF